MATAHFESRDEGVAGALYRSSVPIERLFMTFYETQQMNEMYREAEAVLLHDENADVF